MLKYTRFVLGATLLYIGTLTVVYRTLPSDLRQNDTEVVSRLSGEVTLDEKSEVLLAQPGGRLLSRLGKVWRGLVNSGTPQPLANSADNLLIAALPKAKTTAITADSLSQASSEAYSLSTKINTSSVSKSVNKNPDSLAITAASYAAQAQPDQQQPIANVVYIDIRTQLTYIQTFLDTREDVIKEPGKFGRSKQKIREHVDANLQKNIMEFSNYERLRKELEIISQRLRQKNINYAVYAEDVAEQIQTPAQRQYLKTSVSEFRGRQRL